MHILCVGGGRYFGIPMIKQLLSSGHQITMATRGVSYNPFESKIPCLHFDVMDSFAVKEALDGKRFDVVINKIGYGSMEVKSILDVVECRRFIHMSTAGVYNLNHFDIKEEEFDFNKLHPALCKRGDLPYDDVKRQAEVYLHRSCTVPEWVSVRYPFVLGKKDYTKRLEFYVKAIVDGVPVFIDNFDSKFCVISENDAGNFIAHLAVCSSITNGGINGCSPETISVREIVNYVEQRTGKKLVFDNDGKPAPYNGTQNNSLNTRKAESTGFSFAPINSWLYSLLDYYIEEAS